MKRTLSILTLTCAAALLLAGCDNPPIEKKAVPEFNDETEAAAEYGGGSGTKTDPFIISSAEELKKLATEPQNDDFDTYYKLTTDICIAATEWTPIGLVENANNFYGFQGYFDGGGHTISGTLTSSSDGDPRFGLFGYISHGNVSDLNVNVAVQNNYTSNDYSERVYTGGIVGYLSNGKISGCTVKGSVRDNSALSSAFPTISHQHYVGGVAGNVYTSVIENCVNEAEIITTGLGSNASFRCAGGIAGCNEIRSLLTGCENRGKVVGSPYDYGNLNDQDNTGGIAGVNFSYSTIISCTNFGEVRGGKNKGYLYTGGICGRDYYASIHDSHNHGDVYSGKSSENDSEYVKYSPTGGIAGSTMENSDGKDEIFSCCINYGKVDGAAPSDYNRLGEGTIWDCTESHADTE